MASPCTTMHQQQRASSVNDGLVVPNMRNAVSVRLRLKWALGAAVMSASAVGWACPVDTESRPASTLLVVQGAGISTLALGAPELSTLPAATLTQRQVVSSGASADTQRSVTYSGQLLREVLLRAGLGLPNDRRARFAVIEAVATDGYRAVFSWGELFNTSVGDQVIVIRSQDGRPLDSVAGPVALRSLADLRPGARHVRNLCALVVLR
jgi:hypothetical protein